MKKNMTFVAVSLLVLLVSSFSHAGVVSVQNIAFNIPSGAWYYISDGGGSRFEMNVGGTADVQSYDAAPTVYDYYADNVTLTITPSNLLPPDNSAGGQAMANFADGGILSFSGDLMEDGGTTVLYSGTLLQAELVGQFGDYFELAETTSYSSQVSGTLLLDGMAGLSSGITATNGDTFLIGDMALKFQFLTVGVTDFSSSLLSQVPSVHISGAIPEPATLALLGLGGLLIRRKK